VNIGLSQPQLSRIIGKLETELGAVLLDRSSRRKSGWTPLAHQLAGAYMKSNRIFSSDVQKLLSGAEPKLVHIGTLEGIMPVALQHSYQLLQKSTIQTLDLDVFDLHVLEELFFKGELDVIFTIREPGRKKFKYQCPIGFQSLERVHNKSGKYRVMSSFEFGSMDSRSGAKQAKEEAKTVISNSLSVRRRWLELFGGEGTLPSEVRGSGEIEVLLFAQDHFSAELWRKLSTFAASKTK
jgi:LysR family transcriptional regulator, transcriptional activator for aaeXAB operon